MSRRKTPSIVAALATAAATICALLLGLPSAHAHGVAIVPGSRTYLCYQDGLTGTGALTPTNPACKAAVAQSGTTPLYNWFAVLDSNANGRGQGYVPDGTLCSAGNKSPYDFSAYNAARDDWPKTHLTSGAAIEVDYSNWAAHPGEFRIYLTRQGWSPTTPLAWADLSLLTTVANPPQVGTPGTDGGHYRWNMTLPSGRSGPAEMFIQWVRSDSQENFFSCSDLVFDGGNGEVTGIHLPTSPTSPTPSPSPSASPSSSPTPSPSPSSPGNSPSPRPSSSPSSSPTGPMPSSGCMATYSVVNSWNGGFQAAVEVMNHNTSPITSWTLQWQTGTGTTITSLWNGALTTSGSGVTVKNAAYNGTIAADSSTTFGFTANSTGNNFPTGSISCTAA
ncbi:putative carbohydrate-binding protein with CBM5 and CBM33 domain [Kitasatospora sp. SolWspMP-SS2h]|uniref:lytic polysaccharide monooxygenase n=1 Tax=Kitasatospora sp. SolWspMP-SS2h TaxID=1305729 RepID=UPI000DBAD368|nr:lytic polysaccharide monooxygenase [Kitasatospora sp. SolWspMP-SS2h]RAJ38489.1 putative carbohydrate-binding protein with CBM5 and CBM33 domain [Kitasatospora sp. SolWspMP-SS2h]